VHTKDVTTLASAFGQTVSHVAPNTPKEFSERSSMSYAAAFRAIHCLDGHHPPLTIMIVQHGSL